MSSKTYLWIEDRKGKASYVFWETFMHEICPDVIVESKMNNRELVKAVKGLSDKENRYIIAFDKLEKDPERKKLLEDACGKVAIIHLKKERIFRAAYRGEQFSELNINYEKADLLVRR